MRSRIKRVLSAMFSESGSVSMVRVMSLWSLLMGSIIAVYGVLKGRDLTGVTELTAVFIGGAFGGKVAQKMVEK